MGKLNTPISRAIQVFNGIRQMKDFTQGKDLDDLGACVIALKLMRYISCGKRYKKV
jgi:hypothetical protein